MPLTLVETINVRLIPRVPTFVAVFATEIQDQQGVNFFYEAVRFVMRRTGCPLSEVIKNEDAKNILRTYPILNMVLCQYQSSHNETFKGNPPTVIESITSIVNALSSPYFLQPDDFNLTSWVLNKLKEDGFTLADVEKDSVAKTYFASYPQLAAMVVDPLLTAVNEINARLDEFTKQAIREVGNNAELIMLRLKERIIAALQANGFTLQNIVDSPNPAVKAAFCMHRRMQYILQDYQNSTSNPKPSAASSTASEDPNEKAFRADFRKLMREQGDGLATKLGVPAELKGDKAAVGAAAKRALKDDHPDRNNGVQGERYNAAADARRLIDNNLWGEYRKAREQLAPQAGAKPPQPK